MEKKSVSVTLEHVTKRFRNVKGKADVIAQPAEGDTSAEEAVSSCPVGAIDFE